MSIVGNYTDKFSGPGVYFPPDDPICKKILSGKMKLKELDATVKARLRKNELSNPGKHQL